MQDFPPDWREPTDPRPTYRICRVAFSLAALSHGLLGVNGLGHVFAIVSWDQNLFQLFESPYWEWMVGAPITWASALGCYLLINRFPDPRWRRRAWLLAAMNSVDLVHWCLEHAEILGLPFAAAGPRHPLLQAVGSLTNLAELILYADLAGEFLDHLGHREEVQPRVQSARMVAGIALVLWVLLQMNRWDFRFGWPPQMRRLRRDTLNLYLGSQAAEAISALIVALLCLKASVVCTRVLAEIERHDREDDPFSGTAGRR